MPSSLINSAKAKQNTYVAPRLTVYGDAKTLTAAGTGTVQETGAQPNCQTNGNRFPC